LIGQITFDRLMQLLLLVAEFKVHGGAALRL
jgi:hypothetical protein